jgi:glycosyltransferase involved in cell wall biosynthesis
MSPYFELVDCDDSLQAHAVILWNDVMPNMIAMCSEFQKAKIPVFVMQHGMGATWDYISHKRIPHADYLLCWTEWDKTRAVQDGWDENKIFIVGCPLFNGLYKAEPCTRPKVVFLPSHADTVDADRRNSIQAQDVWHELANIPQIRPVAKLLVREHDADRYPGEKVITDRWCTVGHLKGIQDILSDASLVVTQDCSTFTLLAHALDIPVVKVRNTEPVDEASIECRVSILRDTIIESLANPDALASQRAAMVSKWAGAIEDGPRVAERIAAVITEIVDKGAERVYTSVGVNPSITCFRRFNEACDYYRCALPFTTVEAKSNVGVNLLLRNMPGGELPDAVLGADVFFMPGFDNVKMKTVVKDLKKQGKKVIIDWDDNIFDVSPLSPHYEAWGTEQVRYQWHDGSVLDVWIDGKNIDLKTNRERRDIIRETLSDADVVTVTTPVLADVYGKYNPNVKVLPNCIDMKLWRRLNLIRETDEIRLFWGGGASHYEDWLLLENVLPYIMDMYRNVRLVIAGTTWKGLMKKLPVDRIDFRPWVPIEAYPYATAIADADIGIIPLRDSIFNQCKSPIKWIEMGALSVPCVTSGVSPYKEIATEGNGIFIEDNSPEAWVDGLEMLLKDQDLRKKMGQQAHDYVVEHFDINTQFYQWVNVVKEVVG